LGQLQNIRLVNKTYMKYKLLFFSLISLASVFLTDCSVSGVFVNNDTKFTKAEKTMKNEVAASIYLIGDVGDPSKEKQEPSLASLQKDASENSAPEKMIFFLGDNIYDFGMQAEDDADRKEMERRIDEQMKVITKSNSKGYFIPGNHDWDYWGKDGADAVRRQEKYVEEKSNGKISFLPDNACPGPEIIDVNNDLRIILFDSQWILQDYRYKSADGCSSKNEDEVYKNIEAAFKSAGNKKVLVMAHHPVDSHGEHGGFFDWKAHLFPLRAFVKELWIPFPVIGSLYPLARNLGITSQDMSSSVYKKMASRLDSIYTQYSPVAVAAGHDHSMQVLQMSNYLMLVSGGGLASRIRSLTTGKNTIFAYDDSGYFRIDMLKNGRMKLDVIIPLNEGKESDDIFSIWLN
jgi:hypothetical protein